ncbi:hypothetical protein IC611_03960 [Proteus mirabilis]
MPVAPSVSNETQNVPNTLPPAQDSLNAEQETEDLPEEGEANNTNDNTPVNTTPQTPSTATENWQTYTIKEGKPLHNYLEIISCLSMMRLLWRNQKAHKSR